MYTLDPRPQLFPIALERTDLVREERITPVIVFLQRQHKFDQDVVKSFVITVRLGIFFLYHEAMQDDARLGQDRGAVVQAQIDVKGTRDREHVGGFRDVGGIQEFVSEKHIQRGYAAQCPPNSFPQLNL